MLFNSYIFALVFLPVCVCLYYLLGRFTTRGVQIGMLVAASLGFYAWSDASFLVYLLASILVNYGVGRILAGDWPGLNLDRRFLVVSAVTTNLLVLAQFKYLGFGLHVLSQIMGGSDPLVRIVPPLAISFFTFQQISYVVDIYRGKTAERSLLRYTLFVSFFPQLIAGPIVHHQEVLPQFRNARRGLSLETFTNAFTIFSIGLFKKSVVADGIGRWVDPFFESAASNAVAPSFADAWLGAVGYSLQLYFDFSGYCDMAIGAALLFGIRLPINFNSPYKATSIIEFWRRWHITLSRFLRDYLYIGLGGNRKGATRRHVNLMATMLLGGLWHGASWTFVIWGGAHGLYLMINHAWRAICSRLAWHPQNSLAYRSVSQLLTFTAVVLAFVFFRADSLAAGNRILAAIIGWGGFEGRSQLIQTHLEQPPLLFGNVEVGILVLLVSAVWLLPNTQELMRYVPPGDAEIPVPASQTPALAFTWSPTRRWGVAVGLMVILSLVGMSQAQEFVYFRF